MRPGRPVRCVLVLRTATALVVGAVCAGAVDDLLAAPAPAPLPLARDEALVIRFAGKAPMQRVAAGAITVRTPGPAGAADARGRFVAGRPLVDPASGRAVVVRPEALREHFVLNMGLARADAEVEAERVLARVEKTGNLASLDQIDAALRASLGPAAGTRLDSPVVLAFCPSVSTTDPAQAALRLLRAGDDALWRSYLTGGDVSAFSALQQDARVERLFHPVDPASGIVGPSSVLRGREHRRTLMRRARNVATFLPDVPIRADLSDAGYAAGADYFVAAARPVRTVAKELLPTRGGAVRFFRGLASFRTADDAGDGGLFLGESRALGIDAPPRPRVVDVTPPAGETFLDFTTDWEDPDNQYTTPIPLRKGFVVRLRFSCPLDPRTVDAAHFTLTRLTPTSEPTPIVVLLRQSRTGEVVVEIRPTSMPDPGATYEVRALGSLKALDGAALGTDFVSSF